MTPNTLTPLDFLYTDGNNNSIFIKRDDLIPFSFGGNKARIAKEFIDDMLSQDRDCIIGCGGEKSNLNRALSNICASRGIECHIIVPTSTNNSLSNSFNYDLTQKCKAALHICTKDNVPETIEQIIQECKSNGKKPYYIYGDKSGKGNEAVATRAYIKAYKEIGNQLQDLNKTIDYIFLASGTGMTQSGLIAGKTINSGKETIIGISVAREAKKERQVIREFLKESLKEHTFSYTDQDIIIEDGYVPKNYGQFDSQIEQTIEDVYTHFGIPLDPTYTGKAFTGMLNYISKNTLKNKNILFIHTGGTPLFFDYLRKRTSANIVEPCNDIKILVKFLEQINGTLPTPLSQRVELNQYAQKVTENGNILAISKNNKIRAAILFYANDSNKKRAYITLIATTPQYKKSGYGSQLLNAAELKAQEAGMKYMTLETDFSNTQAIAFYAKRGYKVEYVNSKIHMIKELTKE